MTDARHYVIRGGGEGRERLRVLGRVMRDTSLALFARLGVREGLVCLDVGCGGGDVTLELARLVAPRGRAMGIDMDAKAIELARREALQHGVQNVEFEVADVREPLATSQFDLVYARFLLTHLSDPGSIVRAFCRQLRPGGFVVVEDIDFSGSLTYPASPAHARFEALYTEVVRRRGGDANIGPRLPLLLREAGLEEIGVAAVQPIGIEGDVKLISPLTMENIAEAVLQEGLATREEVDEVVGDLYALAADQGRVSGVPRVVQSWGRRPTA